MTDTHNPPVPVENKPTSPFARIISLLKTGPRGLALRFVDQVYRKLTGAPFWSLSRITPDLYIGGQPYAKGWQTMQDEGITAVLNMREEHHDDRVKGVAGDNHLHLPTRDNTPPTINDLQQAADFIAEQIEQGGKVYVHCGLGVGRAPTAAAAYLIQSGMAVDDALTKIKNVRPFVHLTPGQYRQLHAFADHSKRRVAKS
ncbi:MAG: dual specificity protein phosphatase family protein [Anaerolineae bacterium]|nr:dual specificity protein phosphatase family protein [Anaerolineae bacterium]MCA9887417.1 dual specificity protein phosphatase family protein [Anaerolineae bacterium]